MPIHEVLLSGLAEPAGQRAVEPDRALSSVTEDGAKSVFGHSAQAAVVLPVFGHTSGQILADIEDRDALWALLDETTP
jgi:hypothetical protein